MGIREGRRHDEYLRYITENPLLAEECFVQHDFAACQALLEYKNRGDYLDATGRNHQVTPALMREIAARNGTTTDLMKKHWDCHKNAKDRQEEQEWKDH